MLMLNVTKPELYRRVTSGPVILADGNSFHSQLAPDDGLQMASSPSLQTQSTNGFSLRWPTVMQVESSSPSGRNWESSLRMNGISSGARELVKPFPSEMKG